MAKKKNDPSSINHGNIISKPVALGGTIDEAIHYATISLPQIREYSFPKKDETTTPERDLARDLAGQRIVLALSMVAILAMNKRGYALRSQCDLSRKGKPTLTIIEEYGKRTKIEVTLEEAIEVYKAAVEIAAQEHDLTFADDTRLVPSKGLTELIERSRAAAAEGRSNPSDDDDSTDSQDDEN